jgi:(2Fe-2S) ferredoxin
VNKPKHHIFVCVSSRINGQLKGTCHTKDGLAIMEKFMEEIEERELGGEVFITNTGCFSICGQGPIVVVYPDNVWYGQVTPADVEEIMDSHIEGGKVVKRLEI